MTPRPATRSPRRAFSLVESLVVLGVLMLLASILVPSLSRARTRARDTGVAVDMSSQLQAASMYSEQFQDVFPFAGGSMGHCELYWFEPLVRTEFLQFANGEPEHVRDWFALSICMIYDAAKMRQGFTETIPLYDRTPRAVSRSAVAFPGSKGLLWRPIAAEEKFSGFAWCCTKNAQPAPVGFCDGSVQLVKWTDFVDKDGLLIENEIGYPVTRTWDGVQGIDQRYR